MPARVRHGEEVRRVGGDVDGPVDRDIRGGLGDWDLERCAGGDEAVEVYRIRSVVCPGDRLGGALRWVGDWLGEESEIE